MKINIPIISESHCQTLRKFDSFRDFMFTEMHLKISSDGKISVMNHIHPMSYCMKDYNYDLNNVYSDFIYNHGLKTATDYGYKIYSLVDN